MTFFRLVSLVFFFLQYIVGNLTFTLRLISLCPCLWPMRRVKIIIQTFDDVICLREVFGQPLRFHIRKRITGITESLRKLSFREAIRSDASDDNANRSFSPRSQSRKHSPHVDSTSGDAIIPQSCAKNAPTHFGAHKKTHFGGHGKYPVADACKTRKQRISRI